MSDTINSVKPSEVSDELVALYLLTSIARNTPGATGNIIHGVPIIDGANKSWILSNYVDCLKTVVSRSVKISE